MRFLDPKTTKELTCDLDRKKWASYAKGSQWVGQVGVLSGSLDCDSLKPKP